MSEHVLFGKLILKKENLHFRVLVSPLFIGMLDNFEKKSTFYSICIRIIC